MYQLLLISNSVVERVERVVDVRYVPGTVN